MKIILILEMDKQEALDRFLNDFEGIDPDDKDAVETGMFSIVRDYGTPVYKGREVLN